MNVHITVTAEYLLTTTLRVHYRDAKGDFFVAERLLPYELRVPKHLRSQAGFVFHHRRNVGEQVTNGSAMTLEQQLLQKFTELRSEVEENCQHPITSANVFVPPCYFDKQRVAIRDIVQQAGIPNVHLLNEPIFFLKPYLSCQNLPINSTKYLYFCFDDALFYVSLLESSPQDTIELASCGEMHLCGIDLAENLCNVAMQQHEWSLRGTKSEPWQKGLQYASEVLYNLLEYNYLPTEYEQIVVNYTYATQQKIQAEITKLFELAKLEPEDITQCIFMGNYWKLPHLKQSVLEMVSAQARNKPSESRVMLEACGLPEQKSYSQEPSDPSHELPNPAWSMLNDSSFSESEATFLATPPSHPAPCIACEDMVLEQACQLAEQMPAQEGLLFYQHILEKLQNAAAEYCLVAAEKAKIAQDNVAYKNYLSQGYLFAPLDSIRRRLENFR